MMRRSFWNSEKIVSISAISISLMTLFVFAYQTNIIREQQRLSALPYLSTIYQNTGTANFKLVVKNNGIGPAFVKSIKIMYNGKEFETDLFRFLHENIPEMDSIENIFHSNIHPGQLIPAGQSIAILEVNNSISDSKKLVQLLKILQDQNLNIELIYKSVYDERWKLTFDNNLPEKIE